MLDVLLYAKYLAEERENVNNVDQIIILTQRSYLLNPANKRKKDLRTPKNARKSTNMAPGSKNSIGSKHVVLVSYIIRV